ncbi:MAG: hypothetical protein ABIA75_10010 [Candidatus Neomarinimicrobiota bacterium]
MEEKTAIRGAAGLAEAEVAESPATEQLPVQPDLIDGVGPEKKSPAGPRQANPWLCENMEWLVHFT